MAANVKLLEILVQPKAILASKLAEVSTHQHRYKILSPVEAFQLTW